MKIRIIGCGVNGLSTAIRLLEAGVGEVEIWAKDAPLDSTSNRAAAIWLPYLAEPRNRVLAWGDHAFQVFRDELAGVAETGVHMREGIALYLSHPELPWWAEVVPGVRRAIADEMPPPFGAGFVFTTPVIEMPIYLTYLERRYRALGGRLMMRAVSSLTDACDGCDLLINCAGLGARELADDARVVPVRGQVVRVAPLPTHRFYLVEDESLPITYIIPRTTDCILGGTADVGNWSTTPDPDIAAAIRERCAALVPEAATAEVLGGWVGLRPGSNAVRVEMDAAGIVHNYGHGGAGVTLSWGCAEDVLRLVQEGSR